MYFLLDIDPSLPWYMYIVNALISFVLVCFGGLMSGLTLGLLSIDEMELSILKNAGTEREKNYATRLEPILKNHHWLLVTLLVCNAFAMEALPLFLDKIVPEFVAIVLSVTFVLFFGEIIPQSLCSKYGLSIGANLAWLVYSLQIITFPVSYPLGKLLDWLLPHNLRFYKRAQLKEFVNIHGGHHNEEALSPDEINCIRGVLEMDEKTVGDVMTPLEKVYAIEESSTFNYHLMNEILVKGHSRVPIYRKEKKNFIGVLLIKNLIPLIPDEETSISSVPLRAIEKVGSKRPLWDMLNRFQEGYSHLVAVLDEETKEVVGIVTLEDVIEELIKEEILDENDQIKKEKRLSNKKIRIVKNIHKNKKGATEIVTEIPVDYSEISNEDALKMASNKYNENNNSTNNSGNLEVSIDVSEIQNENMTFSPRKLPKVKFPEFEEKFYDDNLVDNNLTENYENE